MQKVNEITQGRLTAEEKEILRRNSASEINKTIITALLWAFFLITGFSFAILFSLWKWLAPYAGVVRPAAYQLEFIIFSVLIAAAYVFKIALKEMRYARTQKGKENPLKLVKTDIRNDMACILKCGVTRAVEIEEYEDEGAGFLLELDDGRVLCVIGQDMYDYAHDSMDEEGKEPRIRTFPQEQIEYRFAPLSKMRLDVKGTGAPVEIITRVKTTKKFFKKDKASGIVVYTGPEDGKFYEGPLENLLKKFGYPT